jgi:hypothetical protein
MLEGDELEKIVDHDEWRVKMCLRSPILHPIFVAVPTKIILGVVLLRYTRQIARGQSYQTRWGRAELETKEPLATNSSTVATRPLGKGPGAGAGDGAGGGNKPGGRIFNFRFNSLSNGQR